MASLETTTTTTTPIEEQLVNQGLSELNINSNDVIDNEKQQQEEQEQLQDELAESDEAEEESFEIENSAFSMETSDLVQSILKLSKELGGPANLKLMEQLVMTFKGDLEEIKDYLQKSDFQTQQELYEIAQDGFILTLEQFSKLRE